MLAPRPTAAATCVAEVSPAITVSITPLAMDRQLP
jgi:hypothetical protein